MPKAHDAAVASTPPLALRVPAGTVTRYSVAIAKRPSGSNTSVRVPTQRHSPGTAGVSRAGTASRASAAWEVTSTIGCENVIASCGASGTSPSGAWRSTSSGPVAGASGRGGPRSGGNAAAIVAPVRGGGGESSRRANGCSRAGAASGGSRSSTRRAASSPSTCAAGRAGASPRAGSSAPSPSFSTSPGSSAALTPPCAPPSARESCGRRAASVVAPIAAADSSTETTTRRTRGMPLLPSRPAEDTAERSLPFRAREVSRSRFALSSQGCRNVQEGRWVMPVKG